MTAHELRRAEAAYRKSAARTEELRRARNDAVRRAIAEGWTHRQIASATGLTHGRIAQIAAA